MRRPTSTISPRIILWLLICLGSGQAGCDSLMGFSPRPSQQPSKTEPPPGSSTQDAGAGKVTEEGMVAYNAKCQACHGPFTALTTPAGLKKGNLTNPVAAIIRSTCQALPQLTNDELDLIVETLVKLEGKASPTPDKPGQAKSDKNPSVKAK